MLVRTYSTLSVIIVMTNSTEKMNGETSDEYEIPDHRRFGSRHSIIVPGDCIHPASRPYRIRHSKYRCQRNHNGNPEYPGREIKQHGQRNRGSQ